MGCDKDSVCFQDALQSLVKVHAKQDSCPGSEIAGREETTEASKVLVKEVAAILSRRRAEKWTVPLGLISIQTCHVHTVHFTGNINSDAALFEKFCHIHLAEWCNIWCGHFYGMDVETLLALDTSAQEITLKR